MESQLNKSDKPKESKKYLILYFFLAYLITWVCWIIGIYLLSENGYPIPSIDTIITRLENGYINSQHRLYSYLFMIGTYGPMIAAILVITFKDGIAGIRSLMKSILRFRIKPFWFLIIVLIPLGSYFIMLFVNSLSGNNIVAAFSFPHSLWIYLFVFLNQIVTSGLEEVGWRGFATPEYQKFQNAEDSGFMIGLLWGLWHTPFLIYLYNSMDIQPFLMFLYVGGYMMMIAPMGIITVWLYNNTKSTGLLILSHAFNNFIPFLFGNGIIDSTGGILMAAVTWGIAIFLTKRYGKETLLMSK